MKKIALTLLLAFMALGSAHAQTCQSGTIAATTPTSRFTDQGDGTVVDGATGLMWKKCAEGQSYNGDTGGCDGAAATYTWQQALQQAVTVNGAGFAGQSDWRLPNIKELSSIVERQCIDPAINLAVFPATPSGWFWSASPYAGNSDYAWNVSFFNGDVNAYNLSNDNDVRLVRGGQ